jgi:hypothetical protein
MVGYCTRVAIDTAEAFASALESSVEVRVPSQAPLQFEHMQNDLDLQNSTSDRLQSVLHRLYYFDRFSGLVTKKNFSCENNRTNSDRKRSVYARRQKQREALRRSIDVLM